jgi:nitroreductase
MGDVYSTILKRRTIRKYQQTPISMDILKKLVNAARLAPSAANLQPLEYIIVTSSDIRKKVFSTLAWAGYITPLGIPKEGEEPAAYIVVLINRNIVKEGGERDVGAAIENMILAALEEGIASCWICSINRNKLREFLEIPPNLEIDSVLALGYPAEKSVVEEFKGSVKYWKDEEGTLHVPKRKLEDIVHYEKY